jgi:hypothetical protein
VRTWDDGDGVQCPKFKNPIFFTVVATTRKWRSAFRATLVVSVRVGSWGRNTPVPPARSAFWMSDHPARVVSVAILRRSEPLDATKAAPHPRSRF